MFQMGRWADVWRLNNRPPGPLIPRSNRRWAGFEKRHTNKHINRHNSAYPQLWIRIVCIAEARVKSEVRDWHSEV
ncbi:unnamed protein product [Protopolystoma xenopodis]|uniref:Uncharacterized protein n=1 Tax=Protopolystoma xenopodis TaxID=117903 RepID=A0A3S5FGK7_9PLAT|nr:unnamed protein product [Protopolystoma xenopodis]